MSRSSREEVNSKTNPRIQLSVVVNSKGGIELRMLPAALRAQLCLWCLLVCFVQSNGDFAREMMLNIWFSQ
jgi:hypothetical protein